MNKTSDSCSILTCNFNDENYGRRMLSMLKEEGKLPEGDFYFTKANWQFQDHDDGILNLELLVCSGAVYERAKKQGADSPDAGGDSFIPVPGTKRHCYLTSREVEALDAQDEGREPKPLPRLNYIPPSLFEIENPHLYESLPGCNFSKVAQQLFKEEFHLASNEIALAFEAGYCEYKQQVTPIFSVRFGVFRLPENKRKNLSFSDLTFDGSRTKTILLDQDIIKEYTKLIPQMPGFK